MTIMDLIACVAERKGASAASGYPQVIVVHFTKNEYDLPMPVSSENFDVPLIELIKEVKISDKYFFRSNPRASNLLKINPLILLLYVRRRKWRYLFKF